MSPLPSPKPTTRRPSARSVTDGLFLTAAEDLFAARPDLIELTIERRGDGIAWVLMDGRWWALPKGAESGEPL
jgi:transposase